MPTIYLEPNIEAEISSALRASSLVSAALDDRVYTVLPAGVTFPAARIVLIGDVKVTRRPLWIYRAAVQIDVWGGSKIEAWDGVAAIQAALAELEGTTGSTLHYGAVDVASLADTPDPDFTPAKPRFMLSAEITFHPRP